jgi:hypothetical protein
MHNGVFISYRRKDTEGEASRLARDLAVALPDVPLFRDVEAISPGENFVAALERALEECAVMLVLIGPIWLEVTDNNGRRRLNDPKDWTRLEVAEALRRQIRVIPVLCRGAVLPSDADLPDDLDPLLDRQAIQLDNNRWDYDVDKLIDGLAKALNVQRRRPQASTPAATPAPKQARGMPGWLKGAVAMLAILGALVIYAVISEFSDATAVDPVEFNRAVENARRQLDNSTSGQAQVPAPSRAVTPQPVVSAMPSAPPMAVANVAGLWRSNAEVWSIRQQGAQLAVGVQMNGIDIGGGEGLVEGSNVGFRMQVRLPAGMVDVACGGMLVQGDRVINGTCTSIAGTVPLQLVR